MRDAGNTRDLFRRLQEGRGSLQARGDRGGDRSGDLEHGHRRRNPSSRPQDAHFRGNIVQAMLAYTAGELGHARSCRSPTVDRIIAIGSDRMMAAVKGGAPRRAGAVSEDGSRRHRQHQLAYAVHDERSLRAVPAEARRSGDRQGRRSSSRASTRIRSSIASTSRTWPRGCGRTRCRKNWRACGSITCFMGRIFPMFNFTISSRSTCATDSY